MNAIVPVAMPLQDMQTLAVAIAKSALFGIKTPEQALVLMAIAQAEGRHPVEAARDYDIINNRPAKKAEAMLRDFILAGGKIQWHSLTDELADATFTHPQTGEVRIDWDMKRAQTAFGKKDMHTKFPRQMLRSRVVSEGVRTLWPLATSGMYEPGEAADIPAAEHNGSTIEHAAADERTAINDAVPLKPAAAATPRAERKVDPTVYAPPPKSTAPQERTATQWRTWLDKMKAAGDTLYRREELVEMANRASVGDAIANGPQWVRAEISAYLAEAYARFPEEELTDDELPEVKIAGEEKSHERIGGQLEPSAGKRSVWEWRPGVRGRRYAQVNPVAGTTPPSSAPETGVSPQSSLTLGGALFTYAAMPKEITYVRLDPDVKQALVRIAKIDGRSLSALIAKIASDWVKPYPAKPAKEQRL